MTFISNIAAIRKRARKHIEAGAVTPSYSADRETVLKLLNEALATEIVCMLRYRRHYFMAQGLLAEAIKQEFLTHAQEEHAEELSSMLGNLGQLFEPKRAPALVDDELPRTESIAEALK